jgi:D-alanyl-D-alanine carboxypeptidase
MGTLGKSFRTHAPARTLVASIIAALALAAVATVADSASTMRSGGCDRGQVRAPGAGDVCITKDDAIANRLAAAVRKLVDTQPIAGVVFGAWIDGKPVVTGALGDALHGVPATRDDHFRTGNAGEAMLTTVFLRLVDKGVVSLDDPVAKWFPQFPRSDRVTLRMLASSTSGYADFVTSEEFNTRFEADPFQFWTPKEVLDIARKLPRVFAPGTSWAFSDTNFVLLGEVLVRATGRSYEDLLASNVLDRLGMDNTTYTTTSAIPEPTLHAYSNERGVYEETTYWSPSWATYAASATSTLDDMARFSQALGTGSLLSRRSHELQVGPGNVGLGPLTPDRYYGMGAAHTNGWTLANPQVDGYTGVISYFPAKKAVVVVFASFRQGGDISVHYAGMVFNRMGEIIAPGSPPNISVCPRGGC